MHLTKFVDARIIVSLLLLATCVLAGSVVNLDADGFAKGVSETEITLVKFYAPWCGHCKNLAPELDKAASELDESKIKIAKVDCDQDQNKELCSKFEVRGFPTLKIFSGSETSFTEYPKEGRKVLKSREWRKASGIVPYLEKLSKASFTDAKESEYATLSKLAVDSGEIVVAVFAGSDNYNAKEFVEFADAAKTDVTIKRFPASFKKLDSEVAAAMFVPFADEDDEDILFSKEMTVDALWEFVSEDGIPLIAELGAENAAMYLQENRTIAYAFVESAEDRDRLVREIKPIAKDYRKQIYFVYLNATLYGSHAQSLNLPQEFPSFAIAYYGSSGVDKYPLLLKAPAELNSAAIKKLVADYSAGKLQPNIKSEAVPEPNNGDVKIAVADNFESLVMDTEKDVFLKVYAPWCGHCKAMAPAWEQLGRIYKNAANVVIAKFNGDANDIPLVKKNGNEEPEVPFTITGYPSLMLFKAKTNERIMYEMPGRSLKDLLKFVEDNATNKGQGDESVISKGGDSEDEANDDDDDDDDEYLPAGNVGGAGDGDEVDGDDEDDEGESDHEEL